MGFGEKSQGKFVFVNSRMKPKIRENFFEKPRYNTKNQGDKGSINLYQKSGKLEKSFWKALNDLEKSQYESSLSSPEKFWESQVTSRETGKKNIIETAGEKNTIFFDPKKFENKSGSPLPGPKIRGNR